MGLWGTILGGVLGGGIGGLIAGPGGFGAGSGLGVAIGDKLFLKGGKVPEQQGYENIIKAKMGGKVKKFKFQRNPGSKKTTKK